MLGIWSYNSLNLPSTRFPSDESRWPKKAYRRIHFGQHVLWHEFDPEIDTTVVGVVVGGGGGRHLSASALEPYRQLGDEIFDNLLDLYAKEGRPLRPGDDLLTRLPTTTEESNHESNLSKADQALIDALTFYSQLPAWVDQDQLKRGQDVFLAYMPAIGMSLYYRSLVPGFSIPKIAAVLQATAYLAPPASKTAVQERLMDTGAFLGACLRSNNVDDILPHGEGWKAALRVRVLHAKVRRNLLNRRSKSNNNRRQWDCNQLGVPINQEDLAATLLAFSANSLLGAEMLLGRPLPLQDRLDYLALWRYLGWLLGIDVNDDDDDKRVTRTKSEMCGQTHSLKPLDPCGPGWYPSQPNPMEHSYAIFQSIILHNLHPDESSVRMAHHLLRQGRRQDGDNNTTNRETINPKDKEKLQRMDTNFFYFRCIQCRRFVGDDLADALELPFRPTWWGRWIQWGVSTLYLTCLTFYTIAGLPFSPFRQRLIRYHRKHMSNFMDHWTEAHLDRMRKKLKISEEKEVESVCPFSMITSNE